MASNGEVSSADGACTEVVLKSGFMYKQGKTNKR